MHEQLSGVTAHTQLAVRTVYSFIYIFNWFDWEHTIRRNIASAIWNAWNFNNVCACCEQPCEEIPALATIIYHYHFSSIYGGNFIFELMNWTKWKQLIVEIDSICVMIKTQVICVWCCVHVLTVATFQSSQRYRITGGANRVERPFSFRRNWCR